VLHEIRGHTDQITDVKEIKIPFCLASGSLDKTIRLYSMEEHNVIAVLKRHTSGIRSLSYISVFGGYFLSVSHEPNIYLWSPETACSNPFIGSLTGHTDPVVDAKFVPKTTFVVSIDEKIAVKLFDVYTLECK